MSESTDQRACREFLEATLADPVLAAEAQAKIEASRQAEPVPDDRDEIAALREELRIKLGHPTEEQA